MAKMKSSLSQNWTRFLATAIGLVIGYVNFRAAMTFFFIISNTDSPFVLIAILGYAVLLPLALIGFFYPLRAAIVLLAVTAAAFLIGVALSPALQAAIHLGFRFVLPNVLVAALFIVYWRRHQEKALIPGELASPTD